MSEHTKMVDGEVVAGPDLCIAICGEYKCEKLKGHNGPHEALNGDIIWEGLIGHDDQLPHRK